MVQMEGNDIVYLNLVPFKLLPLLFFNEKPFYALHKNDEVHKNNFFWRNQCIVQIN